MVVNDGRMQHDLVHVFSEDEDALVIDLVLLIILLVPRALDSRRGRLEGAGFAWSRSDAGVLRCGRSNRPGEGRQENREPSGALFGRRVISSPRIHPERRQSFRWQQLHFYLTPFAVAHYFAGTVSEDVLVAQLDADFRRDIPQVVGIVDGEGAAPVSSVMSLSNCGPRRSSVAEAYRS